MDANKMNNTLVDDLMQIIDKIDTDSKLISEITHTAKNVLAKDPNALDNSVLEYAIKNHFGESMYDRLRKAYNDFIST